MGPFQSATASRAADARQPRDFLRHTGHAIWNKQAGELWRRTKQAIERHLGQLARRRGAPRSGYLAATANTALWTRSASRTA